MLCPPMREHCDNHAAAAAYQYIIRIERHDDSVLFYHNTAYSAATDYHIIRSSQGLFDVAKTQVEAMAIFAAEELPFEDLPLYVNDSSKLVRDVVKRRLREGPTSDEVRKSVRKYVAAERVLKRLHPDHITTILDLVRAGYSSSEVIEKLRVPRQQVAAVKAHMTMGTYT